MSKIFISYRRSDSQDVTGRIYDALVTHFSRTDVFKDVESIPAGRDFRHALELAVEKADVVIVIIGPRWSSVTNTEGQRRLDDPDDFVVIEIESALGNGIPIIPVTVTNAPMVSSSELPRSIRKLAYLNRLPVRPDPDFHADVSRLISAIENLGSELNEYDERDHGLDKRLKKPRAKRSSAAGSVFTGMLIVYLVSGVILALAGFLGIFCCFGACAGVGWNPRR